MRAEAVPAIGDRAPDFSLEDLSAREFTLSGTSKDNTVVLLFWSTWSGNSPEALQRFEQFYKESKDRGVEVIGINVDNQTLSDHDREQIRRVVKEKGITYRVLLDEGLRVFHLYNIIALPTTVVMTGDKVSFTLPGWPPAGVEELFEHLHNLPALQDRKPPARR